MVELAPDDTSSDLSAAVYESVFYSIQNPALVIDLEFVIHDANQAAVEFLEFESREHLIGTPVEAILANPSILNEVATEISENRYWSGEAEIMTAGERIRMGTGTAVPIDVPGEPTLIAGVFTDTTELRRYTRSLKVLNRILRHNIRNDTNIILGTLEQIAATVKDEQVQGFVETAQDTLRDIIDSADTARELELLLIEQGEPSVGAVRLDRALDEVLSEAAWEYPKAQFDSPDDVPAIKVVADDSIDRVISEVLDNAVVHNDERVPHVRVSVEESEKTVILTVADNGPGVPPERRDMIFGREEISQLHHGEGFSLFFVDQVMEIYGGDVWVEDGDLGGAAFKLEFPRPH